MILNNGNKKTIYENPNTKELRSETTEFKGFHIYTIMFNWFKVLR